MCDNMGNDDNMDDETTETIEMTSTEYMEAVTNDIVHAEVCYEYETSISCDATEEDFTSCQPIYEDFLFYYKTGLRCSNRRIEYKKVIRRCDNMVFALDKFWPLLRTTAIETLTNIRNDVLKMTIHRKIIKVDPKYKFREAIEKRENINGVKYVHVAEVEYGHDTGSNKKDLYDCEVFLINTLSKPMNIVFDEVNLSKTFTCVGYKVQLWHTFSPNHPFYWAYKWDGIKCKLVVNSKAMYLWPDLMPVKNVSYSGNVDYIKNIIFNVEYLDNAIVIFDILCVFYNNHLFGLDHHSLIPALQYLTRNLSNVTIGGKPLHVQKFYLPPIPKTWPDTCDGLIISQKDMIIKWKVPSIDMKCVKKNLFQVGSQTFEIIVPHAEVGQVYEFAPSEDGIKMIRLRHDRISGSTDRELELYNMSCSFFA